MKILSSKTHPFCIKNFVFNVARDLARYSCNSQCIFLREITFASSCACVYVCVCVRVRAQSMSAGESEPLIDMSEHAFK